MALEAVVYPQEPFIRDWYAGTVVGGDIESSWGCWDANNNNYSSPEGAGLHVSAVDEVGGGTISDVVVAPPAPATGRKKRRRTKACKNEEEVENQRMTHIAVERNRRKQMNEYLAVLRSLMPASYVQRGDQASIIGGAINFVKELEQLLQSLEAERRIAAAGANSITGDGYSSTQPFTNFFTFPQYSMSSSSSSSRAPAITGGTPSISVNEVVAESHSSVADIEVTMVERHANLKVLSRRRPRQLLKMVVGLQSLQLSVLHLNLTTVDQLVLYSFSAKVEEDCQLNSADEIATAVHRMLGKIQEESINGLNYSSMHI